MPDRSAIRVKAMLVLRSDDGASHAVARFGPTRENPAGFHRLIGGGVELGEIAREALEREIREELDATVRDAELLDVVENIFTIDGEAGHEVVFVFAGRLVEQDVIPPDGGMFSDDGAPMRVEWRPVDDAAVPIPLYPAGVGALIARSRPLAR